MKCPVCSVGDTVESGAIGCTFIRCRLCGNVADPIAPPEETKTMPIPVIAEVARYLRSARYNFSNENELQRGVEMHLKGRGWGVSREFIIDGANRIDFLVSTNPSGLEPGIGIECKVAGNPAAVAKQLVGYADSAKITGLILLTSRIQLATMMPPEINGKPTDIVRLWSRNF